MKSFNLFPMVIAASIGLVSSSPILEARAAQLEIVHQFPNFTWIENMAVRSNGEILGTDISGSQIYLVDPHRTQTDPPVIAQFANGTRIAGIVEVQEDVFYVPSVQGDVYHFKFLPNATVVWESDATRKDLKSRFAKLLKFQRLPVKGARVEFGVNGVHVANSVLYFINTDLGVLGKVPISVDGILTGSPVNISTSVPAADDFAMDSSGNFWVTENVRNTLVRVSPDGLVQTIAGGSNSSDLFGPVAAVFGRGIHHHNTLYISTDGLSVSGSGVSLTTNGKVVAIDTKGW
ncbi:conserved hypothetical protein [Talaromyces stipitatus ATCC 10500]|uniref:SMP-30/Gluconolactonase/LRE-like region domain-containing protein n=1 Tax=Talaromyces stipitatus (strain ATCC 10500 / CBS 375.48 / QM 6759 / NRRL 1006) TaxID=441959 RepID=B8M7R2_TALSN|nr:uncharacterized protein TSTA_030570 [Talaromyces stipitatus ATCC 10500]EED19791.1 conserved hypothetical protein [Talaromyces stipitatus ATCC 10500]